MTNLNPTPGNSISGKQSDDSSEISVCDFAASEAALVIRNVTAARSILRVVMLAAGAQFDGSVEYEDNNTGRWQPAVDEACARLLTVRNVLMETRSAPQLDWFTSLALVEAIAAALWHGIACSQGERLDAVELENVAQVAIESLDSLMQDCETEGVYQMAGVPKSVALH